MTNAIAKTDRPQGNSQKVHKVHKPLDAIQLEIIKGALVSAQAESEALLERTAMSPVIRVKLDFFVGLLDAEGRLVIGTKQPMFGAILEPILESYPKDEMREGDLYVYNDCYGSGGSVSHSPDLVFLAPIFAEGEIVAFAFSWAHFVDIGGADVGSITPHVKDVLAEGLIIPPIRFVREGKLDDAMFRLLLKNTRFPDMVRGDLRALMAAVRLAENRVIELADRVGASTLGEAFAALILETETIVRRRVHELFKPGTYYFSDAIDGDGRGGGPFRIRLSMTVTEDDITMDATESDDQAKGPVNLLMKDTVLKLIVGMFAIVDDPAVLLNHGAINAIGEIKLRPGSIVQPTWPAPLGQRMMTLIRTISAVAGLMAQADPTTSRGSSSSYAISTVRGKKYPGGPLFNKSSGLGVGHGARSYGDGHDAVYYHSVKNYPSEFIEHIYPVRVTEYAINKDSGGPGQYRGGTGVVREIKVLVEEAIFSIRMDNIINAPYGVNGGMSGRSGRTVINPGTPRERVIEGLADGILLQKGDVIRVETVGGGGWGHPFDRNPETVLADVQNGYVSVESALRDYGVVVGADVDSFDAAKTTQYRADHRWPTKLFHRDRYFDADEWYAAHGAKAVPPVADSRIKRVGANEGAAA